MPGFEVVFTFFWSDTLYNNGRRDAVIKAFPSAVGPNLGFLAAIPGIFQNANGKTCFFYPLEILFVIVLEVFSLAAERSAAIVAGNSGKNFFLNYTIDEILLTAFNQRCNKFITAIDGYFLVKLVKSLQDLNKTLVNGFLPIIFVYIAVIYPETIHALCRNLFGNGIHDEVSPFFLSYINPVLIFPVFVGLQSEFFEQLDNVRILSL